MNPYTNAIYLEEYNRWRDLQDKNSEILSYEEWLKVYKK